MFHRPGTRLITGASLALCALGAFSGSTANADDGPRREQERPTAGASYYLHFGPWGGLCTRSFDTGVGEGEVLHDPHDAVLYVRGRSDAETFVDITRDDQGTPTAWDDELVVEMTFYADGPDTTTAFSMPYFAPGSGELGGLTTKNEPKHTSVGFIFYRGSYETPNALRHRTSIPMRADGWFTVLQSGDDGFDGGGGPDCVLGSNHDDRVVTRDGADYVRGRYGKDLVILGAGNDTVEAGGDDDTMRGGRGNDLLRGESGSDCYDGGEHADVLDDSTPSFVDNNEYTVDDTWEDWITEDWPLMVDVCM